VIYEHFGTIAGVTARLFARRASILAAVATTYNPPEPKRTINEPRVAEGAANTLERFMNQSGSTVSAIVFFLLASACSATAEDGAGALDGAGVADTEQGIGEPGCASLAIAVDKTTNVLPFTWTSPQVYDKPACRKAAIVDARSIGQPARKGVAWADALPATPEACRATFLTSTFYALGPLGYEQSGAPRTGRGVWSNGRCTGPVVNWSDKSQLAYRVVSSARVSPDIASATRRLRVFAE
jgi:hypothetical protein